MSQHPLLFALAARQNVVGPYLPAREELLEGWCGPLVADVEHYGVGLSCIQAPGRHGPMMGLFEVHFRFGGIVMDAEVPLSAIRLDTSRPEVRDHLVRLGCPDWARDVPAAVWAWGSGVGVVDVLRPVTRLGTTTEKFPVWVRLGRNTGDVGWNFAAGDVRIADGETFDMAFVRTCLERDIAALHAGCILRVEGGWLVPMPDGGIGFFEEVNGV